MEWIYENIIAFMAVFVSGITAFYSYFQGRKSNTLQEEQTELQRRVVELEEQREEEKRKHQQSANIEAEIDFEETGSYRLPRKIMIWNYGPADAENIKVIVDGHLPSEVNYLFTKQRKDDIEVLPAGDYYDYPFANFEEDTGTVELKIQYDEPLEEDKIYIKKLRL